MFEMRVDVSFVTEWVVVMTWELMEWDFRSYVCRVFTFWTVGVGSERWMLEIFCRWNGREEEEVEDVKL